MAIDKVEGVDSVTVSLNEGQADIILKPGNRVTVEQIVRIIRENGFTPQGTDVRVSGTVIERDGNPALSVTGLDMVYLVTDHPDAKGNLSRLRKEAMGKPAMVQGYLPEREEKSSEPQPLQIRSFVILDR